MKTITAKDLKALIDSKSDFQLIDVREPYEHEEANIGGLLIPMAEILNRSEEIDTNKQVILHCRSGKRSAASIDALAREKGLNDIYNLEGGIIAYLEL